MFDWYDEFPKDGYVTRKELEKVSINIGTLIFSGDPPHKGVIITLLSKGQNWQYL